MIPLELSTRSFNALNGRAAPHIKNCRGGKYFYNITIHADRLAPPGTACLIYNNNISENWSSILNGGGPNRPPESYCLSRARAVYSASPERQRLCYQIALDSCCRHYPEDAAIILPKTHV